MQRDLVAVDMLQVRQNMVAELEGLGHGLQAQAVLGDVGVVGIIAHTARRAAPVVVGDRPVVGGPRFCRQVDAADPDEVKGGVAVPADQGPDRMGHLGRLQSGRRLV